MGDFDFLDKIQIPKDHEETIRENAANYVRRRVTCEKERAMLLDMLGLVEVSKT